MIALSQRAAWRPRAAWAIRLALGDLGRRRWATVAGVLAFACAGLGAVVAAEHAGTVRVGPAGSGAGAAPTDLIAFLRDDLSLSSRDRLADALRRLPGIRAVRVLGGDQALERLRADLGSRASILDGVEDGFLPATLEVTLEPGGDATAGRPETPRAESLAWRLRRMDGILDVDTVRGRVGAAAGSRVRGGLGVPARAAEAPGAFDLVMGAATVLLALALALAVLRPRRSDAHLMIGLGFTSSAVAIPAALGGIILAAAGIVVAVALVAAGAGLVSAAGHVDLPGLTPVLVRFPSLSMGMIVSSAGGWTALALLLVGAALGWWTGRAGARQVENLALAFE